MERLQGCDGTMIEAGEAAVIQTPTGGIWEKGMRENSPCKTRILGSLRLSGHTAEPRQIRACRTAFKHKQPST